MKRNVLIVIIACFVIVMPDLNAQCTDPDPYIYPENDTVCGLHHEISVQNVQGSGFWSIYINGETPSWVPPTPFTDPDLAITIPFYQEQFVEIQFVWTEVIVEGEDTCTGTAFQNVVFVKHSVSSIGVFPIAEVCGNSYTFNADTTGYGWATGTWLAPNVDAVFDDVNIPNASVEIPIPESFGDSAYVYVPFVWETNNMGCIMRDTIKVFFYQKPDAYAGLDDAVCGNEYSLGAVFSLPENQNYQAYGIWAVHEKPNPMASADIYPALGDSVSVTVSHYGEWKFRFRENNAHFSSCFSIDTVKIEFVEIPLASVGEDKNVCGNCVELSASGSGIWLPVEAWFEDYQSSTTTVCVNSYGPHQFIWEVTNSATTMDLDCIDRDTVTITFWKIPEAFNLTDEADTITCGLKFENLIAEPPEPGMSGFWWSPSEGEYLTGPIQYNTYVIVSNYGYYDFYWIATNGPPFMPDFCTDTAGPHIVHFIENPVANAGEDLLICGLTGQLNAFSSVGIGLWQHQSQNNNVEFENANNPQTTVSAEFFNNENNPYEYLFWTENNYNCIDSDSVKVIFEPIPEEKELLVTPQDGILNPDETGQIQIVDSETDVIYSTTVGGESIGEHITGTGYILDLGSNFIQGTYDVWSEYVPACPVHQGFVTFVENTGSKKIIANITHGNPQVNFPANASNIFLYRTDINNNIIFETEKVLGENGHVEFADLEHGEYYLSSIILEPENYSVYSHIFYEMSHVQEEANSINTDLQTIYIANIFHPQLYQTTGTNSASGTVCHVNNNEFINFAENAVVVLKSSENQNILNICITNEEGNYKFENIPENHDIKIFVTSLEHPDKISYETTTGENEHYEINFIIEGNSVYPGDISEIEDHMFDVSSFKIFPNPAGDNISIKGDYDKANIRIYNLIGKIVKEKLVCNDEFVCVSHLLPGIYIVVITVDESLSGVEKFIKK